MLTIPAAVKLWYGPDPVDMRLGFDGLFALVRNRLQADPLSGHLFIFRNRTADRLKVLYWGGHGLCLFCQRLDRIDNGDHLYETTPDQGLEPMLANPPNAEATKTWPRGGGEGERLGAMELVYVIHT